MAISYQSSDPVVQAQALKWQSLILKQADSAILTTLNTGTGAIVINVQQPVMSDTANAPFLQVFSAVGVARVVSAPVVSGNTISATVTSLAATDVVIVNYVIDESP
jgi:hypothetical protein